MRVQLKELGDKLKQKGSSGKDTVVDATKVSLDKVHAALENLKQNGREYDQRFKVRSKGVVRERHCCR